MPYRHAHFYVGVVLLVILAGFWPSYFSPIRAVPPAFHIHAATAIAWLTLLIVQSVTIQRRSNALHRQLGRASFALFPLLILGLTMIIGVSAHRFAVREYPGVEILAPAFGIGMAIAIAAYLTLFYQALKHRRNVRLHAGYMLATPLILFESPFSRIVGNDLPWLNVIGSPGPRALLDTIALSDAVSLAIALVLYWRHPRHGTPWLVAAGFIAAQALAMWISPFVPGLQGAFAAYARVPEALTLVLAVIAGGLAGWLGWNAAPGRRRPPTGAEPLPA